MYVYRGSDRQCPNCRTSYESKLVSVCQMQDKCSPMTEPFFNVHKTGILLCDDTGWTLYYRKSVLHLLK